MSRVRGIFLQNIKSILHTRNHLGVVMYSADKKKCHEYCYEAKMLSNHNWHKTGQVRIYDPTFKQCHQDRNPVTNIDLTIISSYFENDLF